MVLVTFHSRAEDAAKWNCSISKIEVAALMSKGGYLPASCKEAMGRDCILDAIAVLNQYWNVKQTTNYDRYNMLSAGYQKMLKRKYGLYSAEEYWGGPRFEYEKIWHGYTIEQIRQTSHDWLEIRINVFWSQEGYEGIATYTFSMEYSANKNIWKIRDIYVPHVWASKAQTTLAAIEGDETLTERAGEFDVHPNQVTR